MELPDLSNVTLNTSDTAYRIVLSVKIMSHIRSRLERGHDYRRGNWAPNIQSAIDVFVLPFDFLREQMEKEATTDLKHLLPTAKEVAECARSLAGPGVIPKLGG